MNYRPYLLFLFLSLCSVAVYSAPERLSIVTSIRPLALLVQDLAGDWASVNVIVPPNADPHNMSLKTSARLNLENADLVLWLGPEFERFLEKPMRQRKQASDIAVEDIGGLFDAGEVGGEHGVHDQGVNHQDEHHGRDLHVWLNPKYAEKILVSLTEKLVQLRPGLKVELEGSLNRLVDDIHLSTKRVKAKLLPYKDKTYGVYHDAYSHFGEAFGLVKVAAVNQMPEQRLSAKHLSQLQKDIEGASCIVVERKSAKTARLAKILRVREVAADPLASDSGIQTYIGLLLYMGAAFEQCFSS